ncbi:hypothetical protein HYX16_04160 [Candidatus Woesearchaeota archaeon]|nr:hypothetical protein [Candidatus Woesearchaeota archaeon]
MLELKILKVEHSGKEEAEKLEPFIEECDVFSPEFAYSTERATKKLEDTLENAIKKNDFGFFSDKINSSAYKASPEIREYVLMQYFLLFKHKKPTFYLEKHTKEKGHRLFEIQIDFEKAKFQAFVKSRVTKDIERLAEIFWDILGIEFTLAKIRDKNMVKNILMAESLIRQRYERLREKKTIKLIIAIGGLHNPEKYLNIPASVVDLWKIEQNPISQIYIARANGRKLEEVKDKLVEYLIPILNTN